jgi:class 3 adenylate cyclase
MNVVGWLRQLGFVRYGAVFRENDVTEAVLPSLTADDLKELGVASVGHRRQLLAAVAQLRAGSAPASAPKEVSRAQPSGPLAGNGASGTSGERHQVSAMFCDIVGFKALSSRLDPEDLSAVIKGYQSRIAETIARFGGFIARYVGDGVLIYFGWPEAHEANAERRFVALWR